MSKTFRQWVLLLAVCAAAGLSVFPPAARGADEPRSQVRMTVDFTVLPVVLPDGSESPAMPAQPESAEESADNGQEADVPVAPEPAPEAQAAPETEAAPAIQPAPEPAPAGPGQILSVSLEETGAGPRLAIATDREVADTSYFNLDDPKRLVVDLKGQWNHKGSSVIRSDGPTVLHVVMGEHPDRFRLVIYFRTPPEGALEPTITRSENELIVAVPLP
ncbi:AMIN domain-containing protein [Pseudodesulfovibrio indicus]|uniref:AMIN domain-containing protein n=1 Tax=Pseudodesulfovibrio indicus TaxID=1716143 RepID=A0A140D9J2_9BACT|nr:AMIN domain-containing protein [Pseudodesulfovibrio indicus]AMK09859.1 hypothetical protein AWY79_01405 [Pseudodesulfovibrio indicus]TDT87463.1 AMIN domain-containing protein [Pseudodesulfovibrio indicus]